MNKKSEKILNTTAKLFIQDGIKKITMDDIAEKANVSKVTVYKYFSDKDTLYYEVGKYILSLQISKLNKLVQSDNTLIEKFYGLLALQSDFTDTRFYWLCEELTKFNGRLSDEYKNYLSYYEGTLLHLIDNGIQSGLIKQNLDRQTVFHYVNMGVVYYQQNAEYRNKLKNDFTFQKEFMLFLISNVFVNAEETLTTK